MCVVYVRSIKRTWNMSCEFFAMGDLLCIAAHHWERIMLFITVYVERTGPEPAPNGWYMVRRQVGCRADNLRLPVSSSGMAWALEEDQS